MKKVCGTKMKRIRLLIMNNTTELGIPLRLNLSNPGPSDLRAQRSTSERLLKQEISPSEAHSHHVGLIKCYEPLSIHKWTLQIRQ